MYPHASLCVCARRVCARMHARTPAHEFEFFLGREIEKMECDCRAAAKGYIWKNKLYDNSVLSFDIVIGNLQMQPNKEEQREKNKGKAKLKLSVGT